MKRLILVGLILLSACLAAAQSNISEISGKWAITGNGFPGTMTLDDGKIYMDGLPEEALTGVSFDGKEIRFTRISTLGPDFNQDYTGEVSGDTMQGTFKQVNAGIYQWNAYRARQTENHPPTVSLNYLPEYPTDMDSITLKANAQDPDGDQLMYSWFILGNEIVNETGTELYNQLDPGDYEYTVNVSDGKGGIAEDTVRFTVIKKTPSPPCDRLLLDLEEGQNSVVIAKVVDDCEHNPLSNAILDIRIFHTYDKQLDKAINGEYVDLSQKWTDENGEAIISVSGNPGDMYRVDVYASKEEWDTSDSSIHVTIGEGGESVAGPVDKTNEGALPVPVNLALHKLASQSSTATQWSGNWSASRGVDEVKTGNIFDGGFHTDNEKNPWWQVDLGTRHDLNYVLLYNRQDCCMERAKTLEVLLSDDGQSWQSVYKHDGSIFGGGADGHPLKVDLNGQKARFLRVQLRETNWLHLDEVEVYGNAPTGTRSATRATEGL